MKHPEGPTRRTVLAATGAGLLTAGTGGYLWTRRPAMDNTVRAWRANTGRVFVAHRGAAALVPEHTLESYQAALGWGARCLEISVATTSDGVLICMHDLTYDRTTTLSGRISQQPASVLETGRVRVPRLGQRWAGDRMPRIPRLNDVLDAVGDKAVLAIEAKADRAFDAMIAMIREHGLSDSVLIKLPHNSGRLDQARAAGFPLFVYFLDAAETTPARIDAVAARLSAKRDVLVLPVRAGDNSLLPASLVRHAVSSGIPVWLYPVTRRHEVAYFTALGASGFVTPDLPYLTGSVPPSGRDSWANQDVSPGELTSNPMNDALVLRSSADGVRTIDFPERQSFVCLGQFCPIPNAQRSYRIDVQVRYEALPRDLNSHISFALCHSDDTTYRHREGRTNGYHVVLRANGLMGIYAHSAGNREGELLGRQIRSSPLRAGEWVPVSMEVSPAGIRWSRANVDRIEVADRRWRGGYVHVGRSGRDGPLSLRQLTVTSW